MREIVLDTETTGFDPESGDRLVEIGCVELINHVASGKTYHVYINPERDMPQSAFEVHGLSEEFLSDKPKFSEIMQDFVNFIGSDPLIIHNASFDMKFLNAELKWAGHEPLPMSQSVDTLEMARKKFPGAQNSLDALCRRFGVDNSGRELHGALLDSELLAEVYLELIGGRQPDFGLETAIINQGSSEVQNIGARPKPLASRLSDQEKQAHSAFLDQLKEPLWKKIKAQTD